MLLSKIQVAMLMKCDAGIKPEVMKEAAKYKSNPTGLDLVKSGFNNLVEVNFSQFDSLGMTEGQVTPIQLTSQDN